MGAPRLTQNHRASGDPKGYSALATAQYKMRILKKHIWRCPERASVRWSECSD
jgi:hypothetical protein